MRSITGCGACRLRHLKCDETRPGCHLCITNGRVCPGYAPQFRWTQQLNDSRTLVSDDGEDRVFRRPFSTESHQESMATEITESLGKKTATVALANLDAWLEDHLQAPSAQITQHFQGPFGILDPSIGQNAQNTPPTCAVNHSEHLEDSRGLLLGQTEGIAPGSDSDVEATLVINGTGSEGNTPSRTPSLGLGQATAHYSSNENYPGINTTAMHFAPQAMTPISVGETETQSMCPPIPHKAFELLQHYAESHIAPLPSLRAGPNCPWQTIQYPSAKRTYAEILLRQSASHVSLSLFFSLLAISSRHLAAINDSKEDWKKLQNLFERTTRRHLDLALRNEATCEIRVKYKELLMALLSVAVIEVLTSYSP
ncbi:Zn(II)2Cys6 transcription factor [Penicillium angulare]|uniref:Zn(II)2Cys6 transcription factor n=1 Tax=Penicillium angulare TaxID=116970 RepID=A0A9W9F4P0_9EURO|nr:Zn(II)2Cys6 transcription factor [Penicillium angulare]